MKKVKWDGIISNKEILKLNKELDDIAFKSTYILDTIEKIQSECKHEYECVGSLFLTKYFICKMVS